MPAVLRTSKIRRAFVRRSPQFKLKLRYRRLGRVDATRCLPVVALDISQSGARLLPTASLEAGEQLLVELQGPWFQTPRVRQATVVWSFEISRGGHVAGLRWGELLREEEFEVLTIQ